MRLNDEDGLATSKFRLLLCIGMAALVSLAVTSQGAAATQSKYTVKPIAELKTRQLPSGPLYWRIENFSSVEQAKSAAGSYRWNPDTVSYEGLPSLVAQVAGRVWLFTLGPKGGKTPGGTKVAEIGPVPPIKAPEYLLRVNYGFGPAGSRTPTHAHPGSESFYVISGRLGQKLPSGVKYAKAGHTLTGNPADTPMEVFDAGTSQVEALIMFVVDASRPFSVPTKMN